MRSSGPGTALALALATLSAAALTEIPGPVQAAANEPDPEEQKKRLAAFYARLSEEQRQREERDAYNAAVSTRQVRRARARGKAV